MIIRFLINIFNLHFVSKGRTIYEFLLDGSFLFIILTEFSLIIFLHPLVINSFVVFNLFHYHGIICPHFINKRLISMHIVQLQSVLLPMFFKLDAISKHFLEAFVFLPIFPLIFYIICCLIIDSFADSSLSSHCSRLSLQ